ANVHSLRAGALSYDFDAAAAQDALGIGDSVWGDRAPIQLDKRRRRRLAAVVISAFLSGLCSSRTRATHNLSGPPFRGNHLSFKAWLDQICWASPIHIRRLSPTDHGQKSPEQVVSL